MTLLPGPCCLDPWLLFRAEDGAGRTFLREPCYVDPAAPVREGAVREY